MNKAFFTDITIENFKSLQSIELNGCKRINLFIGKPNVGKSNILEALSLFSFFEKSRLDKRDFDKLVRSDIGTELFFDGEDTKPIKINSNQGSFEVSYQIDEPLKFMTTGEIEYKNISESVKKYVFRTHGIHLQAYGNSSHKSLLSPFGENLLNIIQSNTVLNKEAQKLFKEYDLRLLFDKRTKSLLIAKTAKNEIDLPAIFSMPYGTVADTLQRIIFYKAAILSNNNAILLFEEPEAHAFPPYIVHITQDIINTTNNQFFIATHSPFVLDELIQNARTELVVFLVGLKNGETVTRKLTDEQLEEVYQYGLDLFSTIDSYF